MKVRAFEGVRGRFRSLQRLSLKYRRIVRAGLWGLILAQAVVVSWAARPFVTGDSGRYLELAHNLLAGKGYVISCGGKLVAEGWRLPGYPLFLAGVEWLFGPSLGFVVLCQMGLYLVSIFLLYRLSKRLGENAPAIFLLLCAAYPAAAYASALIMTEAVCVFLIAVAVWLIFRPSTARCMLAGLALGASVYFRPNLLPLGLVVACGMVIAQKRLKAAVLVAVFSLAAVFPLASWNYVRFRRFTPLPAWGGSGIGLFYGAWESVLPTPELASFQDGAPPSSLLRKSGMVAQLRKISLTVGGSADNTYGGFPACDAHRSELADVMLRRVSLRDAERWPGPYLWHAARVGVTNWLPTLALRRFPQPLRLLLWIEVIVMPLLGVLGLVSLARRSGNVRLLGWVVLSGVAYFTISLGWIVSQSRYTVPLRLPLVLGAAALVETLLRRWGRVGSDSSNKEQLRAAFAGAGRPEGDVTPGDSATLSCP